MNAVKRIPSVVQQTRRVLTCVRRYSAEVKVFEHDFILDPRRGQRELIENYSCKGKDFRIELADFQDVDILTKFVTQLFVHKVSMITSIGMTYDELYEFIEPDLTSSLQYELTPIIFHEDRLVATHAMTFFDEAAIAAKMPFSEDLRRSGKAKFEIKPDYAEDIHKGPYSWKGNAYTVFFNEFHRQVGNMLPLDCRRLAFGEVSAVHPDYNGHRLMYEICQIQTRLAVEKYHADYIGAISVSAASVHIGDSHAFTVAQFPFDEFKDNGKIVFDNREDKVESALFRLEKLNKN